ncbi:hypothetical protein A3F65_00605 [Candidatus Saccharibacteria bacterium RIFCSPHIGHO2_12_FULL_47_16b]|nr:MAG: hypothetical protein A3F65_00605 [Candidatus Saccharibacteria bacterium RIFCSPHIGHO2_12_FULL_47_16b]
MSAEQARFEGRVAFVTGTGRPNGIGWATARLLGQEGAFVAAGVRANTDAKKVEGWLTEEGLNGIGVEIDLTDLNGYASIKAKSEARLTRIEEAAGAPVSDLVHIAGVTHDDVAIRMTEEDWTEIDTVKNKGPFFLTVAALRGLRKAKPGNVVSVSSLAALYGHAGQSNYVATNAAMIGWTKSLALEYEGKGVNFNVVAPGLVDTDMTRGKLTAEQWQTLLEMMPDKKALQPEDIASAIAEVLISNKTGQVVVVDGGLSEALSKK